MSSIGQPYGIFYLQRTEAQTLLKNQAKPSKSAFGEKGVMQMLYTLLTVIRAVLAEFVEYILHRLCTA